MKNKSMKKALMALALFAVGLTAASAENLQDVVYLKNGSVIRGIIIEQVPSESIKIQIAGGSVLVLKTDEVTKITKEGFAQGSASAIGSSDDESSYGWNRAPRYRGFVGESVIFNTDGDYTRYMVYTSHGCQINPYVYAGLGIGGNYTWDRDGFWMPIFGHVRGEIHNVLKKNVSPYLDTKIGYSVGDLSGFYCAPAAGCHFYFGHSNIGLSAEVGYMVQKGDWGWYSENGVTVSVALDF